MYFRSPGRTRIQGQDLAKDSLWVEFTGAIHETVSAIGMALSISSMIEHQSQNLDKMRQWIQKVAETHVEVSHVPKDDTEFVTKFEPAFNGDRPDTSTALFLDYGHLDATDTENLQRAQMFLLMMAEDLRKEEVNQEFDTKNWKYFLDSCFWNYTEDQTPGHSDVMISDSPVGAALLHARNVCHRAERLMTSMQSSVPDIWFEFIDRLANKLGSIARMRGTVKFYSHDKHELDCL